VAFGYSYIHEQKRREHSFHVDVINHQAQTILEAIKWGMCQNSLDSVSQVLANQALNPDIYEIKLIDASGKTVASASGLNLPPVVTLSVMDSVFERESNLISSDGEILSIVRPIANSQQCQGCHSGTEGILAYLEVDSRLDPSEVGNMGFLAMMVSLAVISMLLLALALWYLQRKFIQMPLRSLGGAIQVAMDGDMNARATAVGDDEIARLAHSFNQLVDRLDGAQRDLQTAHEKEMEHADRLANVGELASGIAHEIKNPLAGIYTTIQIQLEGTPLDSPEREIAEEMSIQVQRIDKAVRDLLSYACPPSPEFKKGNINDNLSRCVSFIRPLADKQNTNITSEIDLKIPTAFLDSTLLDQVFINVLMNALQALKNGGTIIVTSEYDPDGQMARISIADNGPGLPEGVAERIFRPFYTTKHRGSGLGLSISKKNIERHRGTMSVQSQSGVGTRFIILMPVNVSFGDLLSTGG
jgi:hypothetical protein